jgi:hypothetical protein
MTTIMRLLAFTNYTPDSCSNDTVPIFAVPGTYDGENGLDKCIIKHAKGLDPLTDKNK